MSKRLLTRKIAGFPAQISLPLILVVPFILQIFAIVGLTGWLSLRTGQKAINNLATQLRNEVSARIQKYLEQYLEKPLWLVQVNSDATQQGQLNLNNSQTIERQLWRQMQLFPDIRSNYIGTKEGFFISVTRQENGSLVARVTENFPKRSTYLLDEQGKRRQRLKIDPNYDPRTRPWYQVAVNKEVPTWSIYTFTYGTQGITASKPVFDPKGTFQGVAGVDLSLGYISEFLNSIDISPNAQAFILERSGLMIGSSESFPFAVNSQGKQERIQATESQTPLIRATAQYLRDHFGNFRQIDRAQQFDFFADGERQFVQVQPYRDDRGLDWLVVVVVPEADFTAEIRSNTRLTILLCLAAFGVATWMGAITARWISRPLQRLSSASQAIARGDLNQQVEASGVKELNVLAGSFTQMAQQLQASFTELEKAKVELEVRVQERTADLTRTLEQLQQRQLQLIQSEKMSSLGQLVAGVAHEINNPVSFIHTNLPYADEALENLLKLVELYQAQVPHSTPEIEEQLAITDLEFLQEDLPKLLASMQAGTERIRQIVLSLRSFSRLDEAEVKLSDLHEGLESALLILEGRLKDTEVQVIKTYGDLPKVECRPAQINQVLMNILGNAIDALAAQKKAISDFTPIIEIETKQGTLEKRPGIESSSELELLESSLPSVLILIRDNGVGVPESVKPHIFDPFFTTKPVGKGTGLGLSIAYQIIVEQHQGSLHCHSELGKGAEFLIEIPIKAVEKS